MESIILEYRGPAAIISYKVDRGTCVKSPSESAFGIAKAVTITMKLSINFRECPEPNEPIWKTLSPK